MYFLDFRCVGHTAWVPKGREGRSQAVLQRFSLPKCFIFPDIDFIEKYQIFTSLTFVLIMPIFVFFCFDICTTLFQFFVCFNTIYFPIWYLFHIHWSGFPRSKEIVVVDLWKLFCYISQMEIIIITVIKHKCNLDNAKTGPKTSILLKWENTWRRPASHWERMPILTDCFAAYIIPSSYSSF